MTIICCDSNIFIVHFIKVVRDSRGEEFCLGLGLAVDGGTEVEKERGGAVLQHPHQGSHPRSPRLAAVLRSVEIPDIYITFLHSPHIFVISGITVSLLFVGGSQH